MKTTLSLGPQGEVVVNLTPEQREMLGLGRDPVTVSVELRAEDAASSEEAAPTALSDAEFERTAQRVMHTHGSLFEALANA